MPRMMVEHWVTVLYAVLAIRVDALYDWRMV